MKKTVTVTAKTVTVMKRLCEEFVFPIFTLCVCVVVTVKLIMNEINDDVACNERERGVEVWLLLLLLW